MPAPVRPPFSEIETALREGDLTSARERLQRIDPSGLAREHALSVASLARRAQLPELGLRILGPLVRRRGKTALPATAAEQAEYAEALNRVGASEEALTRLRALDPKDVPAAAFYTASVYMGQWNYEAAIPWLKTYLESDLEPYLQFVVRLNLSAALVAVERFEEAAASLGELRREARRQSWFRLLGNTLQVSASLAIGWRHWEEAEAFISEAGQRLGERAEIESLLVDKWHALLLLHRDGPTSGPLRAVARVREKARTLRHGETLRDCDRHEAIVTGDAELATRVYFGTPFASFRAAFRRKFARPLPDYYDWSVDGAIGAPGKTLSLEKGTWGNQGVVLEPGSVPLRMLGALCADLYRPARVGELHARVYEGEHYNLDSSPLRVHQSITRLRRQLAAASIALFVEESSGEYRLSATDPVTVRLEETAASRFDTYFRPWRAEWPESPFTSRDAGRLVDIQLRVAQRALNWAESNGLVVREGVGKATRYRFKKAG